MPDMRSWTIRWRRSRAEQSAGSSRGHSPSVSRGRSHDHGPIQSLLASSDQRHERISPMKQPTGHERKLGQVRPTQPWPVWCDR